MHPGTKAPGQHRQSQAGRELMLALQASDWGWDNLNINAEVFNQQLKLPDQQQHPEEQPVAYWSSAMSLVRARWSSAMPLVRLRWSSECIHSQSFNETGCDTEKVSQPISAGKQQQQVKLKLLLTTCAHERQVSSVHNAGLELELLHLQQTCKKDVTVIGPAMCML
ncbi:MAG: hypothetical protein FRX49_01116 [Trebouxia sp. A1-2]|nr:MAG: hypothetical protein FRX49_01116 [Trebouxia sp. A1-2]